VRPRRGPRLNFEPHRPATTHLLDVEAASTANQVMNRWYLEPITGGAYPADAARELGWAGDEVRPGDMALIAAPIDFLGVNYYTCRAVRSPHLADAALLAADPPEVTAMGWEVHPDGLGEVLDFVRSRTGELPLYVMENGAAYDDDPQDPSRDPERVRYLERHVDAALAAVERGVPLRGYFAWSLLDNFEWHDGYAFRFGLVRVDFATLERRVRDSGRYWGRLAAGGRPVPT
jgi:beta-glucosidase